jgi:hypothetical protein
MFLLIAEKFLSIFIVFVVSFFILFIILYFLSFVNRFVIIFAEINSTRLPQCVLTYIQLQDLANQDSSRFLLMQSGIRSIHVSTDTYNQADENLGQESL